MRYLIRTMTGDYRDIIEADSPQEACRYFMTRTFPSENGSRELFVCAIPSLDQEIQMTVKREWIATQQVEKEDDEG